jgi:hypothetical protein
MRRRSLRTVRRCGAAFYCFHRGAGSEPILNPFPLDRSPRAGRARFRVASILDVATTITHVSMSEQQADAVRVEREDV